MRRNLELDAELEAELSQAAAITNKAAGDVLIDAVRVGLPIITNLARDVRPEGYFADAYSDDAERQALEVAMAEFEQRPER